MGIRPNKTNFGLLFRDWRANVKRRREEEEKKKRKKRRKVWKSCFCMETTFVCIHDFEYGNFEYGSVCMDISGSISRV